MLTTRELLTETMERLFNPMTPSCLITVRAG